MSSVHIINYGCSNNQAEGQIMAGYLEKSGFSIVGNEDKADIIVVNTCSVKGKTESKIMHKINELQKIYPGKKLIISGCLPEAELGRVRHAAPNSAIVSTNHISKISVAADFALQNETVVFVGKNKEEKVNVPKIRTNGVVDIVPISSGCMSYCTFCSTKLAKGDLFSFSEKAIIDEIRNAKVGAGAKEFWLTSQDNGCYGFDHKTNPARLMKNIITNVSGKYFLRFGMANPQHFKWFMPEILDVYEDDHVFKFLHLPVQSGSNSVLQSMARGHTVDDYRNIVEAFREKFPEITIWTDIIVGFPQETEEDFQQTIELLEETRPDVVNVSSYSARPGTRAARMKKIPTEVVKERTKILAEILKEIYLERNKGWLGLSDSVIVDEFNQAKNSFIGRNYAYKPIVIKNSENIELGQIANVKIINYTSTYLIGEIID